MTNFNNFRNIKSVDELFCKLMEELNGSLDNLNEPFDVEVNVGPYAIYVLKKSTQELLSKIPYTQDELLNFVNEFLDRIK